MLKRWLLVLVAACGGSSHGSADAPGGGDAPRADAPGSADAPSDVAPCATCTWAVHFGGDEFGNSISVVTTDAQGNIYVAGGMAGTIDLGGGPLTSAGPEDVLVASFTAHGDYRWAKRFGSTDIDQAGGLAIAGGKLYLLADFIGTVDFGGGGLVSAGRTDIAVVELDPATGAYVSAIRFGTANDDTGIGIAVDGSGNVAFGGFFGQGTLQIGTGSLVGPGQDNGFVASITSSGAYRWARSFASSSSTGISSCQALAIDGAGDVITAGTFDGTVDFGAGPATASDSDAFVASYSPAGAPRWSHVFGSFNYDSADTVALDAAGDVYIGGVFHDTVDFGTGGLTATMPVDGYVAGFSGATGTVKFARALGAAMGGSVRGVTAGGGTVGLTGNVQGDLDFGTGNLAALGLYDIFVAGIDPATGATQFAKRYGGSDYDEGNALAIVPAGPVVVGGGFSGTVDLGTGTITGGTKDNGFALAFVP